MQYNIDIPNRNAYNVADAGQTQWGSCREGPVLPLFN